MDSLGELQALNSMTDEELAQYAALYDQKYALCNLIAADSPFPAADGYRDKTGGDVGSHQCKSKRVFGHL